MIGIIILFLIGIVMFAVWRAKIHVDWRSTIAQTLPLDRGVFGVYCFTGKQGSGKTYSLNKFIRKQAKGKKIYSNLTFFELDYTKLETIDDLFALSDQRNCYIVYDEIFTLMQKQTRFDEKIMTFLSQMRKQKNIFITTAQEWLELPMTYRRYVRIQVECTTFPLGFLGGIIVETYYDATNMKWSQLDNEYVAPLMTKKISKYEKRFMLTYDTNERIKKLDDGRGSTNKVVVHDQKKNQPESLQKDPKQYITTTQRKPISIIDVRKI